MADIKDALTSFAKNATKTSGDFFKTTKLTLAVSTEQNNLKNLYHEIGKKVHEIYQYGGTLGKFFDEKYLELEACESKITELKEQISQIKGTRECIKCGKTAERTAEFCPKCGVRMAVISTSEVDPIPPQPMQTQEESVAPEPYVTAPQSSPAPPQPSPPPPKSTRKCRVCGAENDANTKFCLSCGRIVD